MKIKGFKPNKKEMELFLYEQDEFIILANGDGTHYPINLIQISSNGIEFFPGAKDLLMKENYEIGNLKFGKLGQLISEDDN